MSYKIAIKKNETNEIKLCTIDREWDEVEFSMWTTGNNSCDCNLLNVWNNTNCETNPCSNDEFEPIYVELQNGKKDFFNNGLIGLVGEVMIVEDTDGREEVGT